MVEQLVELSAYLLKAEVDKGVAANLSKQTYSCALLNLMKQGRDLRKARILE